MKQYSITLLFIIAFFFPQLSLYAADMLLGADKAKVSVGSTVTATVYVDTLSATINSAEGIVSFSEDILSVESVSMSGSIFSIWVEQPSFSNSAGTVSFNGGLPNPGFKGSRGSVVRITFKAKKIGIATLGFDAGNIYANDGLGTDVTSAKRGIAIEVVKASDATKTPIPTSNTTPAAPVVESVEMPDPETWYPINQAVFTWNPTIQTVSTQVSVNAIGDSKPNITYTPPIGNKEISGLVDGVSYLHVRLSNANGWGATTHRKLKIDTAPPTELLATSSVTSDQYVKLFLSSQDKTSGVEMYRVLYDGNVLEEITVESSLSNSIEFLLSALPPGVRELSLQAFDKAGNKIETTLSVVVPSIKTPVITHYPEVVTKGDRIEISGTTYPRGDVLIYIQEEKKDIKSYPVKADESGVFVFKSDATSTIGLTSIWAAATRGQVVMSEPSAPVYIQINRSLMVRTSLSMIEALTVIIPLILLILLLIFTTYYGFHKFRTMRKRLHRDLGQVEGESEQIFDVLKTDVKNSVKVVKDLSKAGEISKEGKETFDLLSKDVDQAGEYLTKRIKKIEMEDL